MRIAIDATPAAVQQSGVGRYTRELLKALVQLPAEDRYLLVAAADEQGSRNLLSELPPGAWREAVRLPVNDRVAAIMWHRLGIPLPVERIIGTFDIFHGTDYVLPPTHKKSVVTIHDLSYKFVPEFAEPSLVDFLDHAVSRVLRRVSAVITVSASVAAEVAFVYPHVRDKIFAIPNGVNAVPDVSAGGHRGRPRVLIVGTIEPRKNHLTLLRAMEWVWAHEPDVELVIAGRSGWRSGNIECAIANAAEKGSVIWRRSPSDATLNRLYSTATVVVYPSYYEGFGLPVLEGMARGVPVVASDVVALRETGGDAALYVDPHDPEAFSAAIVKLLENKSLRATYARRGKDRARQFTWRQTAERTHRVYELIANDYVE